MRRLSLLMSVLGLALMGCMAEATQEFRLDPAVKVRQFDVTADYQDVYRRIMTCVQKDYPGIVRGTTFTNVRAAQITVGFVPAAGPPVVLMCMDIISPSPESASVRVYYRPTPQAVVRDEQVAAVEACARAVPVPSSPR